MQDGIEEDSYLIIKELNEFKTFDLEKVTGIHHHCIKNGKILYSVIIEPNQIGPTFTIDTCYSLHLYYKVWDYLLFDVNKQCPDLTKLTRSFEIYKFIEIFKEELNDGLTLSDALNNITATRKPKNSDNNIRNLLSMILLKNLFCSMIVTWYLEL